MLINVELMAHDRPKGALGLLIPQPVDVPWMRFANFVEPLPRAQCIAPDGRGPQAHFIANPTEGFVLKLEYRTAANADASHLFQGLDKTTDAQLDFGSEWINLDCEGGNSDARVRAAVAAVAKQFDYGPKNDSLGDSVASCNLLTGNCIDINTVLLCYLHKAGVQASYVAGYYFADHHVPADGMHCWVATKTENGYLEWDIAHALKAGRDATIPMSETDRGLRVPISFGRNIVYQIDDLRFSLEHFVQPRWLLTDGRAPLASVTTTLAF
jgi:hypothetical protein